MMLQSCDEKDLEENRLLMDHSTHPNDQHKEIDFMTLKPSLDKPRLQPEKSLEAVIPCHPLGIKPLGNLYMSRRNITEAAGLFYSIPDDLLLQILEFLEPLPLLQLGATCKALWAFSRHEDLWRIQYVKYVCF